MVSLVINSLRRWRTTAEDLLHRGVRWQPPTRGTRHPARADSDEPDARGADAQAVGRRSRIGEEYEAGLAQTEDGAGGGQAEVRTCARGRGTRLLKIRESRTRMQGRDNVFE